MATPQELFELLFEQAEDDPNIIGLVLTGSRGKGFGNDASDHDILMVVRPEVLSAYRARFAEAESWAALDWWVTSLPELEGVAATWDEPLAWEVFCNDRYGFADVTVLVDKTGSLQHIIDDKGFVPEERRLPVVRVALGAYTNSLYRSLKCLRNGNQLGARLEAADAVGHALTAIFALEGRHRPYYGYLARELAARPLQSFPLATEELLETIETILNGANAQAQQRLLAIVESRGRQFGCDEEFDEWGSDLTWMKHYEGDRESSVVSRESAIRQGRSTANSPSYGGHA